ncbi:MAG: hypothetical protein AAF639_46115 [Chloroflexota bacterium]
MSFYCITLITVCLLCLSACGATTQQQAQRNHYRFATLAAQATLEAQPNVEPLVTVLPTQGSVAQPALPVVDLPALNNTSIQIAIQGPTETPTHTPAPTRTPTPQPTPQPTITPVPTSTQQSTATRRIVPINTPTPVPRPIVVAASLPTPTQVVSQVSARASSQASQLSQSTCPTTSTRQYTLIPMENVDNSHVDSAHGDLNLGLRGYQQVNQAARLVAYDGQTDPNAPKLNHILIDGHTSMLISTYQVHEWLWGCGTDGCRGGLLTDFDTTLIGIATERDKPLSIPYRGPQIYSGGFVAAVLYADTHQMTIAYGRSGSVADAYVVHLEDFCVDPNLLTQYQKANAAGRRMLPALRNGDIIGLAKGSQVLVAIRDKGKFMDPRSRKDWW